MTNARASRGRPPSQYFVRGWAARLNTHWDRSPRSVATTTYGPNWVAANGLRRRLPLFRPTVSNTMNPLGTIRGEPRPARTAGSTTRLSIRKNSTSSDRFTVFSAIRDTPKEHGSASLGFRRPRGSVRLELRPILDRFHRDEGHPGGRIRNKPEPAQPFRTPICQMTHAAVRLCGHPLSPCTAAGAAPNDSDTFEFCRSHNL